eukprot:1194811-Prorocentrum_minimum.AAC.2
MRVNPRVNWGKVARNDKANDTIKRHDTTNEQTPRRTNAAGTSSSSLRVRTCLIRAVYLYAFIPLYLYTSLIGRIRVRTCRPSNARRCLTVHHNRAADSCDAFVRSLEGAINGPARKSRWPTTTSERLHTWNTLKRASHPRPAALAEGVYKWPTPIEREKIPFAR